MIRILFGYFMGFMRVIFRVAVLVAAIILVWIDPEGIGLRIVVTVLVILQALLLYQNKIISTKTQFQYHDLSSTMREHLIKGRKK